MTVPAVHQRSSNVSSHSHERNSADENEYESLSHTTRACKYHVVFIPKCRRKTLYQELRRHLGEVFRRLALQKESKVEEGHLMRGSRAHAVIDPAEWRCRRWWVSSRARARSTWPGFMESANAISWGSTFSARGFFGADAVRPIGKPSAPTFAIKRIKALRADEPLAWPQAALGGCRTIRQRQRPLPPLSAAQS